MLNERKIDIKEFAISNQAGNKMHVPTTLIARHEMGRPASKKQVGHSYQDIHES